MNKFGDEKLFVVGSPPGEVTKGFPEVESKWMFGDKEVVVPKASKLRLYHGWKKWREGAKADLKRKLLEDDDFAKSYVAEKQERVLLDRDRVASKTWYNDEQKRWEIDPTTVPYAVSRKLVENARIRHDWAVMYITLKGDEHEYFVNIKDYDMHFENSGGIDELYLRMLASGVPTFVQLMWIPFFELDIREHFLLILRVSEQTFTGFWNFRFVSYAREWALKKIRNTSDDIMMMIVFPIVEFIRMQLGMAWPEYVDQTVGSTWYLKWQSEAEMSFRSRKKKDNFKWFISFVVRGAIYGYIVFNVIRFMRRKIPRLLGYGPLRSKDPNFKKLDRVMGEREMSGQAGKECIHKCKQLHGNSPHETISFFKVMLGDNFSKILFLPPKVAKQFKNLVDKEIKLEDMNNEICPVILSIVDGSFAFQNGWNVFSNDHNLNIGDFLVFRSKQLNHFVIEIFDRRGCPKPIFPKNSSNKRKTLNGPQAHTPNSTTLKMRNSGMNETNVIVPVQQNIVAASETNVIIPVQQNTVAASETNVIIPDH